MELFTSYRVQTTRSGKLRGIISTIRPTYNYVSLGNSVLKGNAEENDRVSIVRIIQIIRRAEQPMNI